MPPDAYRPEVSERVYRAIADGGEGAVLVMSNGGHPDAALGGGRKLSRGRHTGLAGVLADGRLRDFDDLSGYGFVTYCRGETVRQGGHLVMPMDVNVPVEISGVTVLPGDYVYADSSGAAIIPAVALSPLRSRISFNANQINTICAAEISAEIAFTTAV